MQCGHRALISHSLNSRRMNCDVLLLWLRTLNGQSVWLLRVTISQDIRKRFIKPWARCMTRLTNTGHNSFEQLELISIVGKSLTLQRHCTHCIVTHLDQSLVTISLKLVIVVSIVVDWSGRNTALLLTPLKDWKLCLRSQGIRKSLRCNKWTMGNAVWHGSTTLTILIASWVKITLYYLLRFAATGFSIQITHRTERKLWIKSKSVLPMQIIIVYQNIFNVSKQAHILASIKLNTFSNKRS